MCHAGSLGVVFERINSEGTVGSRQAQRSKVHFGCWHAVFAATSRSGDLAFPVSCKPHLYIRLGSLAIPVKPSIQCSCEKIQTHHLDC